MTWLTARWRHNLSAPLRKEKKEIIIQTLTCWATVSRGKLYFILKCKWTEICYSDLKWLYCGNFRYKQDFTALLPYLSLSFLLPLWTGISGSRLTGLTGEMLEEWLSCSCSKRSILKSRSTAAHTILSVSDPDPGTDAFWPADLGSGSGMEKIQSQDPGWTSRILFLRT